MLKSVLESQISNLELKRDSMRCNFLCDLACIDYNFAVESVEHDLFRDDIHQSVPSTFKSEAIPRLTSTNKKVKLFHIPFLFAFKQLTKTYQALYLKQNVKEKNHFFISRTSRSATTLTK